MQDLYVFEIKDEIKHTNKVKLENLLKKGKEQLIKKLMPLHTTL